MIVLGGVEIKLRENVAPSQRRIDLEENDKDTFSSKYGMIEIL